MQGDDKHREQHIAVIADALESSKKRRGAARLYNEVGDELRSTAISNDIRNKNSFLQEVYKGPRVDLWNVEEIQKRVADYMTACERTSTFPSMQGLAALGFGISRQRLYKFLHEYPTSDTAQFIEVVREAFADILANSALQRRSDSVMAIFVLKNNHGFADAVSIDFASGGNADDFENVSIDDMSKRYAIFDDIKE